MRNQKRLKGRALPAFRNKLLIAARSLSSSSSSRLSVWCRNTQNVAQLDVNNTVGNGTRQPARVPFSLEIKVLIIVRYTSISIELDETELAIMLPMGIYRYKGVYPHLLSYSAPAPDKVSLLYLRDCILYVSPAQN